MKRTRSDNEPKIIQPPKKKRRLDDYDTNPRRRSPRLAAKAKQEQEKTEERQRKINNRNENLEENLVENLEENSVENDSVNSNEISNDLYYDFSDFLEKYKYSKESVLYHHVMSNRPFLCFCAVCDVYDAAQRAKDITNEDIRQYQMMRRQYQADYQMDEDFNQYHDDKKQTKEKPSNKKANGRKTQQQSKKQSVNLPSHVMNSTISKLSAFIRSVSDIESAYDPLLAGGNGIIPWEEAEPILNVYYEFYDLLNRLKGMEVAWITFLNQAKSGEKNIYTNITTLGKFENFGIWAHLIRKNCKSDGIRTAGDLIAVITKHQINVQG